MNLEDHLGDILAKARAMRGVSRAEAARVAGLSEAELGEWEASGRSCGTPDLAALATRLGLDAAKLEAIASGWRPAPVNVSAWRQLRVLTSTDCGMAVNSYLVWEESSRQAALFDTGWSVGEALGQIEAHGLVLRHLCITHGHRDHVAVLGALVEAFPDVHVHRGTGGAGAEPDRSVDLFRLGAGQRVSARATPGHAADGVTYVVSHWPGGAPAVAFVGDALFAGSMGRGNQSWELARRAVRERILSLPLETLICPGHGPLTTVAEERAHNPFF